MKSKQVILIILLGIFFSCNKTKSEIEVVGASIVFDEGLRDPIQGLNLLLKMNNSDIEKSTFYLIYCIEHKCVKIPLRVLTEEIDNKHNEHEHLLSLYSDLYELKIITEQSKIEVDDRFMQNFIFNIQLIFETQGNLKIVNFSSDFNFRFISNSLPTKIIELK